MPNMQAACYKASACISATAIDVLNQLFAENICSFFNIADKPAFMLLSLRRGRDWKTWLTEIEEEGCIGKIVEELI